MALIAAGNVIADAVVRIKPDTRLFKAELQKELAEALALVKSANAEIKVRADTDPVKAELAKTQAIINKAKAKIDIGANSTPAKSEIAEIQAILNSLKADVEITGDTDKFNRELLKLQGRVESLGDDVEIGADTKGALAKIKSLQLQINNLKEEQRLGLDTAPAKKDIAELQAQLNLLKNDILIGGDTSPAMADLIQLEAAINAVRPDVTVGLDTSQARAELIALGSLLNGLQTALGRIGTIALGLGGIGAGLGAIGAGVGVAGLAITASLDSVLFGFDRLTGGGKVAEDALKSLQEVALQTPFSYKDVIQLGFRLKSAGRETASLADDARILSDALAVTGGSAAQLEGALFQIQQTSGRTKLLDREDLRTINNQIPGFREAYRQLFGDKMEFDTTDDLQAAIFKSLESIPGAAGAAAAATENTFMGRFSKMQDAIQIGMLDAFLPRKSEIFAGLDAITEDFLTFIDKFAPVAAKAIAEILPMVGDAIVALEPILTTFTQAFPLIIEKIIDGVTWIGKKFDELGLSSEQLAKIILGLLVGGAFLKFSSVIAGILAPLTALGRVMTFISPAFASAAGPVAKLKIILAGLLGPVGLVVIAISGLIASLGYLYKTDKDVRKSLQESWASIREALSEAWNAIKPILLALGKLLVAAFVEVAKKFAQFLSFITGNKALMKAFTFAVIGITAAFIGLGVAIGIISGINAALGLIAAVANPVVLIIGAIVLVVAAVATTVALLYKKHEGFRTAVQQVWENLKQILENLKPVWDSFMATLKSGLESAKQILSALAPLWEKNFKLIVGFLAISFLATVHGWVVVLNGLALVLEKSARDIQKFTDALGISSPAQRDAKEKADAHKKALDAYNDSITDARTKTDALKESLDKLQGAHRSAERAALSEEDAKWALQDAQEEYNKKVKEFGEGSDPALRALNDLKTSELDYKDAQDATKESIDGLNKAKKDSADADNERIKAEKDVIKNQKELAEASKESENAMQKLSNIAKSGGSGAMKSWNKVVEYLGGVWDSVVEKWNSFKDKAVEIFTGIGDFITEKWNWVKEKASEIFESIVTTISEKITSIKEFIQPLVDTITSIFAAIGVVIYNIHATAVGVFELLKSAISTAWNWIWTTVLEPVFTWIVDKWNWVVATTTSVWETIKSAISTAWNGIWTTVLEPVFTWIADKWNWISSVASSVWDAISSKISGVWDSLTSGIQSAVNWVQEKWNWLVEQAGSLKGKITTATSGMWDGIKNGVKSAINAAIRVMNSGIRLINKGWVNLPGKQKAIPEIDTLYKGTRSYKGGLSLVGERGPELLYVPQGSQVTPSNRTAEMMSRLGAAILSPQIRRTPQNNNNFAALSANQGSTTVQREGDNYYTTIQGVSFEDAAARFDNQLRNRNKRL